MSFTNFAVLAATVVVLILYAIAGFAVKHRWDHRMVLNPLKIIAAPNGTASLSSAQVLFFTIIVIWLAVFWAIKQGALVPLDESMLWLLGIAIVGTGVGKATDATRFRITAENWAWARGKNWIKKDFTQASVDRTPRFSDLLATDRGFDIARFQAVGFSLVIGIALLCNGATAENAETFSAFVIDDAYLTLIGISQGAYVGGKYTGGNLFRELNVKLDKIRALDIAFSSTAANAAAWQSASTQERTMKLASECAPDQYVEFVRVAEEAAVIVEDMTGNAIDTSRLQPSLPAFVA